MFATTVGHMTAWFERRPGSEETLLALYDAVGVAEELDLAEQAHNEASWTEAGVLPDWTSDEVDAPVDPTEGEEDDDAERITMSQAVGVIEHLLGGRPMHGGD